MGEQHPELASEQAHIDSIYSNLEKTRSDAMKLKSMVEVGAGGTNQARYEREVIYENIATRLNDLDIGDRSVCFGRIDQDEENDGESYYIGRLGVSDENQNVLVVDWRAPIAEAFYRATGVQSLGLIRRRHFTTRNEKLLSIEDEFFGDAAGKNSASVGGRQLQGEGALIAALEDNRSGHLGDIVGTIQGEQDRIIRASKKGVLVVQGGPGTGKTVVALHRAAYLLYEHRFPLDSQGVLVIGPNRLFLGYIEQVLPSLGEAGVELSVLADLVKNIRVQGRDKPEASRVKGDLRMIDVLAKAVKDRQRTLKENVVINMGARRLTLTANVLENIVKRARSKYRDHNAAAKFVENEIYLALEQAHPDDKELRVIREQLRYSTQLQELFLSVWPVLTPAQLLHDLFGSKALLASAGKSLTQAERDALYRDWQDEKDASRVVWTVEDVALLDEAWELLGPNPKDKEKDFIRTYGHIVVDEAQDLSPLQLRMLTRRSLNGSMTIVGDIGQSTGVWAHENWEEILEHLPERHESIRAELTIGYRIPQPLMEVAAKVLTHAAPEITPPTSVRTKGDPPTYVQTEADTLIDEVCKLTLKMSAERSEGNLAVICPVSLYELLIEKFVNNNVDIGRGLKDGLDKQITVMPVHVVKGLEVNTAIVVEPAAIVEEEFQGARSLYVALTRATQYLAIVNARPLPEFMV